MQNNFAGNQKTKGGIGETLRRVLGLGLLIIVPVTLLTIGVMFSSFDEGTKPRIYQAHLADLNGDGHLDAFLVYFNRLHRVLLNDGSGNLTRARELMMHSYALALGDLNSDGQLEAILNNFEGQETGLLCAKAPAGFSLDPPETGGSSQVFALKDSNKDGEPESFIAGCCNGSTVVYNYDTFSDPSPCLSQERSNAVALADLNGDGHLDAFLARGQVTNQRRWAQHNTPNEVWLNDGQGNFTDSGQRLGQAESLVIAVGDMNGDGFPDVVVGNRGPDEVWLNDGQGGFSSSNQRFDSSTTQALFLADLDGDGDLDLFAAGGTSGRAWLNDGAGQFRAGQTIAYTRHQAIAVGDVTGDGIPDVFVAGLDSYEVWRGSGDGQFQAEH